MLHLDLVDLRLFLHVVEAGSITGGAARSHLALPSASARIRGMERRAGLALLERGRRGVSPTPAGRASPTMRASCCSRCGSCRGNWPATRRA